MKQGTSKALILIVMLASTIAAMVLRQMQLIRVFDADGLPISGSPITYALAAICVVTLAALLLLLRRTPPRQEYYCSIFLTLPGMILTLLAALAVGVGSLIQFGDSIALTPALTSEAESIHWSHLILPIGGILTALCILLTVNRMANMRRPLLALYLVPFAFIVVYLVLEFKNQWSADPIILDYCFYLFALICTMYALYYVMGFCFDRGRRAPCHLLVSGGLLLLPRKCAGQRCVALHLLRRPGSVDAVAGHPAADRQDSRLCQASRRSGGRRKANCRRESGIEGTGGNGQNGN